MGDAFAEQFSSQWVVYTELGQYGYAKQNWFNDKGFPTRQEAQEFLDGPARDWPGSPPRSKDGWLGPIKVEQLSSPGDHFGGPWLADVLKDADLDSEWSWDKRFNGDWEACAADVVEPVMKRMEAKGELPSESPAPNRLSSEQQQLVQRRLAKYKLPEFECRLGADWDFEETELNARLLTAHRTPNGTLGYERRLFAAAVEIEKLARQQHGGRLRASDVCHLWTSLDLWLHLARFCREKLWVSEGPLGQKADPQLIEEARLRFCGRLGSYVLDVRSSPPPRRQVIGSTVTQESSWEDLSEKPKRIIQGTAIVPVPTADQRQTGNDAVAQEALKPGEDLAFEEPRADAGLAATVTALTPEVRNLAHPQSAAMQEEAMAESTDPTNPTANTRPKFIGAPKPPTELERRIPETAVSRRGQLPPSSWTRGARASHLRGLGGQPKCRHEVCSLDRRGTGTQC